MDNKKIIRLEDINENWFLNNVSQEKNKLYSIIKRVTDLFLGFIGFLLFIIFFPFVWTAIKLDSKGNVIFKQNRVGKNGKIFVVYKFRTMHEKITSNEQLWREKNKDSITRVGKILRKSHLDELPQAINILKGDMSFVGPRAEWVELSKIFEKEIKFYNYRYIIKPGLIGWAQINFPASKSVEQAREKFEYDLYYIKNRSLLLDAEIILKSVKLFLF